jgi:hypothetical protein
LLATGVLDKYQIKDCSGNCWTALSVNKYESDVIMEPCNGGADQRWAFYIQAADSHFNRAAG